MKTKEFKRYTPKGLPVYENEHGERLCCIEGCYSKSHMHPLCGKHAQDENDYTDYLNSIRKKLNTYNLINDEYYEVTVPNSKDIFIVDKDNLSFLKKYNWRASDPNKEHNYLITKISNNYKETTLRFHVEIMKNNHPDFEDYNKRIIVDHIDGNFLDNRKSNLRVRTQSENNMNKTIQSNNSTGMVGVYWVKKAKLWNAKISIKNKVIDLGYFYYLRNAVRARVEAEDKYFGEHAYRLRDEEYNSKIQYYLNLPTKSEPFILKVKSMNIKYPLGVSKVKNTYVSRIEKDGKIESKCFKELNDAIEWRRMKEIDYYGDNILYSTDKKEKQI
ncbi:HNH endonuclease [Metabacillus fastidiosus]|uniref:HNH endonuclease n=1 Tax=Metabacillus fastidiosus TaxID=1458 RepID=UPI003D2B61A1